MKTDNEIHKDVINKLEFEPTINASKLTMSVKNGVVTLGGVVSNYFEKRAAERAVLNITGVKAIANEIKVDILERFKRGDAEIAKAAVSALQWHTNVPTDKVKVTVENGRITLTGDVDWWHQRKSAEKAVRNLVGVVSVNNHIVIKPSIRPEDVKNKIEREFERNAQIDAKKVEITTSGSTITLKGNVRSWAEVQEAARAAWSVPGVTHVDNRLAIVYH